MRIALIGSSGFLGRNFLEFTSLDHEILEASRSTGVDITRSTGVRDVIDFAPDVIVSLAGMVGVVSVESHAPGSALAANNEVALGVCEAALGAKASVIHIGSYVYGSPDYLPVDELHPVRPNNFYALSKVTSDSVVEFFHNNYGLSAAILRPFNIFGRYQPENYLLPSIVSQLRNSGCVLLDSLYSKRDHLWVGDLVSLVLQMALEGSSGFDIYNVGFGSSISNYDVAKYVGLRFNNPVIRASGFPRPREVGDCFADITKLQSRYKWSPSLSIYDYIDLMPIS